MKVHTKVTSISCDLRYTLSYKSEDTSNISVTYIPVNVLNLIFGEYHGHVYYRRREFYTWYLENTKVAYFALTLREYNNQSSATEVIIVILKRMNILRHGDRRCIFCVILQII